MGKIRTDVAFFDVITKGKAKGKTIPLQAWTEGSRKMRLPDLKTIGT
jgi:hypothetical protein